MSNKRIIIPVIVVVAVVLLLVVWWVINRSPEPAATATATTATTAESTPVVEPTARPTAEAFSSPLSPVSPLPTPSEPIPTVVATDPEKGVVTGSLYGIPSSWPMTFVFLAPFTAIDDSGNAGFYVLEPSVHPSVQVEESGFFKVEGIDPGKYVIIIGPSPEQAVSSMDEDEPKVIEVKAGEVLELGYIEVMP